MSRAARPRGKLWPGLAAAAIVAFLPMRASALDILGGLGIVESVPDYDAAAAGSWLSQIAKADGFPKKPYSAPDDLLQPYANASLGPQMAYALVKGVHVAQAPEVQAYCQRIVDKLLTEWGGPVPSVRILITSGADYGARANFTGDIFIDIGTFNKAADGHVTSEDELALMLGHELGHFLLMHESRKQAMQDATDALTTAASIYGTYALVHNTHMSGRTIQIQADKQMYMNSVIGGLATTMLVGDVFAPSWGRDEEEEADRIGVDLARAAGYYVTDSVMASFITKQTNEEAKRSQRMKMLQAVSSLMVLAAKTGVAQSNSQFGGILDAAIKLGGISLIDKAMSSLAGATQEHPDPKARLAALQSYAHKVYGTAPPMENGKRAKLHTTTLRPLLNERSLVAMTRSAVTAAHVATLLATRMAAEGARQAATARSPAAPVTQLASVQKTQADTAQAIHTQAGKDDAVAGGQQQAQPPLPPLPSPCRGRDAVLPEAPPLLATPERISLSFPVDQEPFTWRVRGDWRDVSTGCARTAVADYDRSAASGYATIDLLHTIAKLSLQSPNPKLVTRTYDRYVALIGTDHDFPDLAVAAAMARQDVATAEVKAADCLAYQRHAYYPICAALLGYDPTQQQTPARTAEGRKAFSQKGLDSSFHDMFHGALFGGG